MLKFPLTFWKKVLATGRTVWYDISAFRIAEDFLSVPNLVGRENEAARGKN